MMRRIVTKLQTKAEAQPMPQSDDEVLQFVTEFVEGLPQPHREIFVRHRQGETFRQIAAAMNLGPKTVLKSIARSHSHLRMFLMPDDSVANASNS